MHDALVIARAVGGLQPITDTLDRVGFGYRDGQSVLRDVSAAIRPGEMVAVVGYSRKLNENTVLQRNARVNQATHDQIREIQSPRVVRLGARLSF